MNPFWKGFFEDFKERGRDASPFLLTLAALVGLLIAGAMFDEITHDPAAADFMLQALLWAAAIVVVGMVIRVRTAMRRGRSRQPEAWERRELSCDERRVARSKLKSGMNQFKSVKPAVRPPDTDLKM